MIKNKHIQKQKKLIKKITDVFYKSSTAIKQQEERKTKRLFWKYIDLD